MNSGFTAYLLFLQLFCRDIYKKSAQIRFVRFVSIIYLGESRSRNITQIPQDVELNSHVHVLSFLS